MYDEVKLDQVYNLLREFKKTRDTVNRLEADAEKKEAFGINVDGDSFYGVGKYHDDPGFAGILISAIKIYQREILDKLKDFGLWLTPDEKDKK